MDIESKAWRLRRFNAATVAVTQKATGETRYPSRDTFPDVHALAMMHESRFDSLCRDAFHNAARQ